MLLIKAIFIAFKNLKMRIYSPGEALHILITHLQLDFLHRQTQSIQQKDKNEKNLVLTAIAMLVSGQPRQKHGC
jgi:hypothetical protein